MKPLLQLSLVLLSFSFLGIAQTEQPVTYSAVEIDRNVLSMNGTIQIDAANAKYYQIDVDQIESQMVGVAHREDPFSGFIANIQLPHPDGTFHAYRAKENNTLHPDLRNKFVGIHTYDATGVEEPAYVKWDVTLSGFHAMIMRPGKSTIYIDPAIKGNRDYYIVYERSEYSTTDQLSCDVASQISSERNGQVLPGQNLFSYTTCELRTYRAAIAATGEYTSYHGGTVAAAQSAQAVTMNRVNGVYERDMAITMVIVANNDQIIYTNAGSDPYTNGTPGTMINQNQTNVDNVIGSANYDIGHVFGTNSGGLAGLGVVCIGGQKARGVTGSANPIGDPFDIDYVAHEMGHQFNANHTQYNTCNRNNATAMEPGSASTIMGYAGICAPNVQSNSDDHFHGISLEEIGNHLASTSCPVITSISNSPPTITATNGNVTVPAGTPFALTATVTDPDGDPVSYCWEQMDNTGNATQPPQPTNTQGPQFRSNSPTTDPTRYFPNLTDLAAGVSPTWEVVPTVSRTMNFRLSVRDNSSAAGGCNDFTDVTVSTDAGSGPFIVQYPSNTGIVWNAFTSETVTWDVANTDLAPVACANVDILLSTDGGLTYPITLATNVPNDGSESIIVPNVGTVEARVMVICSNGTFFDISDNDFEIVESSFDYTLTTTPTTLTACQPADVTYSVDIGSIGGYNDPVSLSVSGVPTGAISSFSVDPVTPVGSSALVISNTGAATPGAYTLTITANSTSGTKTNDVTLIISAGAPAVPTLTSPTNGLLGVTLPATLDWSAVAGSGVTYEIDIATDAGFTSIVDQAIGLTSNTYDAAGLLENTTYYWRVRAVNSCGSSAWSTTYSFTTQACSVYVSTDVGQVITNGSTTVTSIINVPDAGSITDLNITLLDISHDWVGDLSATLESPSGTVVQLFDGPGIPASTYGCNGDDINVSFDDAATLTATDFENTCAGSVPTISGTYQSMDLLSIFNGESMTGDWILTIDDSYAASDDGILNAWSLEVCTDPVILCNDPDVPTLSYSGGTVCEGDNVTINIAGNLNDATEWVVYEGSCGGTLVGSTTTSTITVTPSAPNTIYYVQGEDGPGCVDEAALSCGVLTVVVTEVPVISLGTESNPTTCGGTDGSIVVNGTGTGDVSWTGTASGTASGVSLPYTISGLGSGNYDITFSNGCTSNTVNQTLSDPTPPATPVVTASGPTTFCDGGSVALSSSYVSGNTWSTTETTQVINLTISGTYTVTYTDGNGCSATSAPITATVNPTPTTPVVTAGGPTTFCDGGSVTLTSSEPTGNLWSTGSTSSNIVVSTSGSYDVTYTDGNGCSSTSVPTVVTVNPAPVISLGAFSNPSACATATGSIEITGSGTGIVGWTGTASGNSGTVTLPYTITGLIAGNYDIVFVDPSTCTSNTLNQTLTDPTPPATPTITAGGPTTFCDGGSVTLTSSYTSENAWSNAETAQSITVTTSGTYTVTYTDGGGCTSTSAPVVVTVNANPVTPTITAGGPTTFCSGGSVALTSSEATGNEWSTTETSQTINVSASGSYTVTYTDGNGCSATSAPTVVSVNALPSAPVVTTGGPTTFCDGGSVTLTSSQASGNVWSTTETTQSISAINSGSYTVTYTDGNGCSATSAPVVVSVNPLPAVPVVTASGATTFCDGGSVDLTSSYLSDNVWSTTETTGSITVTSSGTYTVTYTDGNGCSTTSASTVVTVNANPVAPVVTASGATTFCDGGSVDLTSSYLSDNVWSTTETTGSIPVSTSGSYTVTYTDGNGCSATSTPTVVTVNANPTTPTVTASGPTTFCDGGSVDLTSSYSSGNVWSTTETTGSITVSASGSYTVTYTDANGCSATSASTDVTVNPLPSVSIGTLADVCLQEVSFTLTGATPAGGTYAGPGVSTGIFDPAAAGTGAHTITYSYTDLNGCSNSDQTDIIVNDCASIEDVDEAYISVYPNPATSTVTVVSSDDQITMIEIYDAAGRLVNRLHTNTDEIAVDVSEYANGVYSINVYTTASTCRTRAVKQ